MASVKAWTFDPGHFHAWLGERVIVGGKVDIGQLEGLMRLIIQNAKPVAREYLLAMVCDVADQEEVAALFTNFRDSHLSRWYALAMAEHLERAPSPDKPGILIAGLRLAGWGDDRIFGLFGTTLPSLVEACGIRPFVKQFTNAFYGTWMPVSEAGRLLKWLRQDEQFFLNPTDQTLTSLQVGTEERQALRGSLSAAYQGTVMMLEAAVTSNKPLRIIADFS